MDETKMSTAEKDDFVFSWLQHLDSIVSLTSRVGDQKINLPCPLWMQSHVVEHFKKQGLKLVLTKGHAFGQLLIFERVDDFVPYDNIGFEGVRLFGGIRTGLEMHGGEAVEIAAFSQLHEKIIEALCSCDVDLTPGMIKVLRLHADLSQEALAQRLGYADRQMISLHERGQCRMTPTDQQLLKMMALRKFYPSVGLGFIMDMLELPAPETFDFKIEDNRWKWINNPRIKK